MACCGNKAPRPMRSRTSSDSGKTVQQTKPARQAVTPTRDTTRGADRIRGLKWTSQK